MCCASCCLFIQNGWLSQPKWCDDRRYIEVTSCNIGLVEEGMQHETIGISDKVIAAGVYSECDCLDFLVLSNTYLVFQLRLFLRYCLTKHNIWIL
mmetsp:Transcript_2297/g.3103  ORF Transcript_2297/g.3103 Transcript_2297/m.3103 type:complete len:95 (-) Transcript_2297:598-882(-)